jgi:hypothetical protein
MTFYFDSEENELVGNNAFDERLGFASEDDDSLVMDVDFIMEEGRGLRKLREMRRAVDAAIEANADTDDAEA